MHALDAAVAVIATAQYALISSAQAIVAGLTHTMIHDRWRAGLWIRMFPGVYRLAGAARSWEQNAMAACLWAGPDAVISGRSAAYLWRLEGFGPPGRIEITVPRGTRLARVPGVIVHESKAWDLVGRTTRFGVPVAGIARTILDVCAWGAYVDGLRALDEARRRHLVDWPELWETLIRHACRGRNGIRLFRRVLVRRNRKTPPGGEFARLFLIMLEASGFPEPECEVRVTVEGHTYFIDLAYPGLMLGIELDDSSHDTEKAEEEDPVRQARLEAAGWHILRFTWWELTHETHRVIATMREAIRSGERH